MKSRHHVSVASLVLAAGLAGSLARNAAAQTDSALNWANAAGGAASTTTNWSPNQMPTVNDDLTFNLLATYTVTYSSLVPSAHTHTYKRGTTTLSLSSPHTVTNGITIGDISGDNATVTLTTGTLNSTATVFVGDAAGSTGVLNVNDVDADLLINGAGTDLFIGNNGAGTLTITGGGLVQVADQFFAGANAAAVSTITVSGNHSPLPFTSSHLNVLGVSQSGIGLGGDVTMNITNGGLADFAGSLVIANGSVSTSSVTVQGAGLIAGAKLNVASDLLIGRNTSAAAAGNGTLNVGASGSATIGGTLFLGGDPNGGTGAIHLTDSSALITTHSLAIGNGATLDLDDGKLIVDGGTLSYTNSAAAFVLGGGPLGIFQSHFVMDNGATANLTPTVGSRALTVGGGPSSNFAVLTLDNASQITLPTGDLVLGESSDDSGDMFLVNGSTLTVSQPNSIIAVGNAGLGGLILGSGTAANLIGQRLFIGLFAGSNGEINMDGHSVAAQVQELGVGGSSTLAGGTGSLLVADGATLTILGPGTNMHVWPSGSLSVSGSTITSSGGIVVDGGFTLDGGAIRAAAINVNNNASATGTIDGHFVFGQSSSVTLTLTGPLTAGHAGAGQFDNIGTISVGDNTLTIVNGSVSPLNNCAVGSQGLVIAANGVSVGSTSTLSGDGTIEATIANSGHIASTGNGLTFNGIVTGVGTGITGATTHYLQGGGFNGGGTIGTAIDADNQAVFNASSGLTMGAAGSNFGVVMDGTLHCGGSTVTLLDANGIGLGVLTDLIGGTLVCAQNLTVNPGKTIAGRGTVQTPLLTVNGAVKPADTTLAPDRGLLSISGAVTLGVNDTYFCDIDPGVEFASSDQIVSTGPAIVGGALSVAFIHGYTPVASHTFDVVIGSSRTGIFSSVTTPPLGSFGPAHVEYFPDRARLVLCYANCDGSVTSPALNVLDFACFLNKFAAGDPYANCDSSTTPPVLNVLDFACFLNKFAAGCP